MFYVGYIFKLVDYCSLILFPWRYDKWLLITKLRTSRSKISNKVHLDEPLSFTGVSYNNIERELLAGAEMNQRQLHHPSPH